LIEDQQPSALPEPIAQDVVRRALRILDGESASPEPIAGGDFTKPVFDWRQLKRWNINESSLPPASEIRFRSPSLWEEYRWLIVATLALVLVQAATSCASYQPIQ
jgi:hypothetical protein